MRRFWTAVGKRRPSLGLTPPTSSSPATPPKVFRICKQVSTRFVAGAAISLGLIPLSPTSAYKVKPFEVRVRQEARSIPGRATLGSIRRPNPVAPSDVQYIHRKFWTPVGKRRPTLGNIPITSVIPASPARFFDVRYGSRPRFAGDVIFTTPPKPGATLQPINFDKRLNLFYGQSVEVRGISLRSAPRRPTVVVIPTGTIKSFEIFRKDQRGFAGRVVFFGPRKTGVLLSLCPPPFVVVQPSSIYVPSGRAVLGEPKKTQPIILVNARSKGLRIFVGGQARRAGKVIRFIPRREGLVATGTTKHGLVRITNLQILLNVKREVDSGDINASSGDVGGTQVFFNKAFKDIDSLTATVQSTTEPFIVIYDFVDVPDPTGFKVFVFDTTGNRVSKLVSWKARGVVGSPAAQTISPIPFQSSGFQAIQSRLRRFAGRIVKWGRK